MEEIITPRIMNTAFHWGSLFVVRSTNMTYKNKQTLYRLCVCFSFSFFYCFIFLWEFFHSYDDITSYIRSVTYLDARCSEPWLIYARCSEPWLISCHRSRSCVVMDFQFQNVVRYLFQVIFYLHASSIRSVLFPNKLCTWLRYILFLRLCKSVSPDIL